MREIGPPGGSSEAFAGIDRSRREPAHALAHPQCRMSAGRQLWPYLGDVILQDVDDPVHLRNQQHRPSLGWGPFDDFPKRTIMDPYPPNHGAFRFRRRSTRSTRSTRDDSVRRVPNA